MWCLSLAVNVKVKQAVNQESNWNGVGQKYSTLQTSWFTKAKQVSPNPKPEHCHSPTAD